MLKIGSSTLLLLVWFQLGPSIVQSLHHNANASFPITLSISSCPARTINYITHTLPQQCLPTSRSPLLTSVASPTAREPHAAISADATSDHGSTSEETPPANRTTTAYIEGQYAEEAGSVVQSTSTQPTSSAGSPTPSTAPTPLDLGPDSPLDHSKFLSFEEWKKQNLAKLGQSPDNVGHGRGPANAEARRRPINNALDSLGDDGEIEIDFTGFGGGRTDDTAPGRMASGPNSKTSDTPSSSESPTAIAKHRSKDAGKTCKERFNYASFDCAATILKTNPKCKSSSQVLSENKDSYMLNECSQPNKFMIIEMCDDILVDTIVLANYEFFSSMFRTVRVSVSDRYPVKADKWRELGIYEARNTREVQAFLVQNPLIWARYLRIEFLTHYGSEFYCPVSLVRVHGTTMMEEVRRSQEDGSRAEDEIDDDLSETEVQSSVQDTQVVEQAPVPFTSAVTSKEAVETEAANATILPPEMETLTDNSIQPVTAEKMPPTSAETDSTTQADSNGTGDMTTKGGPHKISALLGSSGSSTQSHEASKTNLEKSAVSQTSFAPVEGPERSPVKPASSPPAASHSSSVQSKSMRGSSQPVAKEESRSMRPSAENSKSSPPSATQPQPAQPTTQESFFKSTSKRLAMLETNSSLNIQYIEEQSRILRDAFVQTEKHQLRKTENFLSHLNDTVMAELQGFRQQYDQLWQSTVIELETNRENYQREMLAISSRITIMADELVFQKRMIVVQSILLLLCLGLTIFVRSGSSYMELPLMQQMMNKSHSMLKLSFDSPLESPSSRRTSPLRNDTRRLVRMSSGSSDGSLGSPSPDRLGHPGLRFSPPTPSDAGRSERAKSPSLSPEEMRIVRETRSGPATPSGTRETQQIAWDTPISVADDSPLLHTRQGDLQSQESRPSSSRYSGSSDSDGDVNVKTSTTDESAPKSVRHRASASGLNSMSNGGGDTAAELMSVDGLRNGE
ncbi:sad1 unc domain protein [Venturia nashicola]|nr:sad1 unc domain protein [Venturia nashicola]